MNTAGTQIIPVSGTSDVLVVGAGPIGLVNALFLAQQGWSVTILERWPTPYPQPRAVSLDDEGARLLARLGLADRLAHITEPATTYSWQNADGDVLIGFDWAGPGISGWPTCSMYNQPTLEAELVILAEAAPTITIHRGVEAVELARHDDSVSVVAAGPDGERHTFTASYVIGCDGANSFVREQMDTTVTDLGFFFDWLIVDVIPNEERTWNPVNLQICDPRRPTTAVSGGPGRRRWEFMRMPGETIEDLNTEKKAWELLEPWNLTADNAILERHAVYTFQAKWADRWRDGRLLLAGDAAHLMPPFAGQGLCSGLRDAANLTFKLDLVLRGLANASVLDTYSAERTVHVQHAINKSIELGKVICVADPAAAAQRDAVMLARGGEPERVLPRIPPAVIADGLLHGSEGGTSAPEVGTLSAQGHLAYRGRTGLLDDVLGSGFVLLSAVDPKTVLSEDARKFLAEIGARVVHLVGTGEEVVSEDGAVDLDAAYLPALAAAGTVASLVRPDHYIFGVAATAGDIEVLIEDLRCQLDRRSVPVHAAV